jgi:transcriptional regulator GlxA family with amidase domain
MWITPSGEGIDFWMCHSRSTQHLESASGEKAFVPNKHLPQFLTAFQDEVEVVGRPLETVLQQLVQILLVSICRDLRQLHAVLPPNSPDSSGRSIVINDIDRAVHYINDHLGEHLSLDMLARRVGMSRSGLTKRFREETGYSVHQYISNCRLERAKTLLQETNWSMRSIARLTGLRTSHDLRRFFQQHIGMTPLQYRAQMYRLALTGDPVT